MPQSALATLIVKEWCYVYYVNGPNITNHISHVAPYRKKITNITNFMLEKQNQCTCHTLRRL